jgi:ganglioside GM2 activator
VLQQVITVISLRIESEEMVRSQEDNQTTEAQTNESDRVQPMSFKLSGNWANCSSNGQIVISQLQYYPQPVVIPGDLWLGVQANVLQDLNVVPLSIKMYKKVLGFWVKLPCTNGMGSCSFSDVCSQWPIPSPCPAAYTANHIPCSCPFKAGRYSLPLSKLFALQKGLVPSWLEEGIYKTTVQISSADSSSTLMCAVMYMTVQSS